MKEKIRKPLEKILKKIQEDRKLYDSSTKSYYHQNKLTVLGLADAICLDMIRCSPKKFNVSEIDSHRLQEYFNSPYQFMREKIIELYKEFPEVFEGEAKEYVKELNLPDTIPLF